MTTPQALEHEVHSFFGLVFINLMFSALAIGLGISIIIGPATALLTQAPTDVAQVAVQGATIGLGMIGFGLGFSWILVSVPMIEGVSEIQNELDRNKKTIDETKTTSLYIRLLSFYRAKRDVVQRMTLFGKIGGSLFILTGIINAILSIYRLAGYELIGAFVTIAIGIAILLLTRSFISHATIWDQRLAESKTIEDTLTTQLGTQTP